MEKDEQDQETQLEEQTEEEGESSEEESKDTEPSDPLDALSEEDLRKEAKKFRSIAQRKAQKKDEGNPIPSDVVKKSDFEKANESKARRKLEADSRPEAKEILEHWDEIAEIYGGVARRGKNSEDDIFDDLLDAHAVWKRNAPEPKPDTKEAEAQVAQSTGKGGSSPEGTEQKKSRIITPSKKMDDWYPKQD